MSKRQKGKNRKRPRSWHRGRGEDQRFLWATRRLDQIGDPAHYKRDKQAEETRIAPPSPDAS